MQKHNIRLIGAALLIVVLAACGNPDSVRSSPAPTEPATTAVEPATTQPAAADIRPASTMVSPTTNVGGDPADAYLGDTTEIYSRDLAGAQHFVARLSTESYAELFGMTWNAPTGSAEQCLGEHAVFLGVPDTVGYWGSAWVAWRWYEKDDAHLATLQASMGTDDAYSTVYLLFQTDPAVAQLVLLSSGGIELDRATVVDGVVMLVAVQQLQAEGSTVGDLSVATIAADGEQSAPVSVSTTWRTTPTECGAGDPPVQQLPSPGAQPANPDGAAAQIRGRHALLVDQSVPADQKPVDLLDDYTGVQAAIDGLATSQFRDAAASAKYTIDDLVFTQPDEAWFRYTITTSTSTFSDRIGHATFSSGAWHITRATICQDLALAQSPCRPDEQTVLPADPAYDAAYHAWVSRAMLYPEGDGCPPLSQC